MKQGEIVAIGPRERFYATPEHAYSRALIDAAQ